MYTIFIAEAEKRSSEAEIVAGRDVYTIGAVAE